MLTESEKRTLLQIARQSISSVLNHTTPPAADDSSPNLEVRRGVFVTLYLDSELRGCIGFIDARGSLTETVREAAVKAAFDDPRFLPVTPEELKHIDIEISVLSAMKRLKKIEEIEIGVHGLVVESGRRRGLLLPQVAGEYGWDGGIFFKQTLKKAGLPSTTEIHRDVRAFTFTAEVFSEHQSSVPRT